MSLTRSIVPLTLLALPALLVAEVKTLTAVKDNTLYETGDGSLSNGAGDGLAVGKTNRGFGVRRALLQFDLSSIPVGSTVTDVSIDMNLARSMGPGGGISVYVYRVTNSWGEGTSAANGNLAGAGTTSTAGDATWMHRFYSGTAWNTPGGDFDSDLLSSTTIDDPLGIKTFPSSANFVADVQGWVDNPASNFGLILIGDESVDGGAQRLDSREAFLAANRPLLRVTYTPVPEPASLSLIALGAAAMLRRRRVY